MKNLLCLYLEQMILLFAMDALITALENLRV